MSQPNERESFFIVPMWVATELNLKGAEMLVYSIIYSFSQNGTSFFYGSIDYMCRATNLDKSTIMRTLKSLLDKNLIAKKDVSDLRQYGIDKVAHGVAYRIQRGGI